MPALSEISVSAKKVRYNLKMRSLSISLRLSSLSVNINAFLDSYRCPKYRSHLNFWKKRDRIKCSPCMKQVQNTLILIKLANKCICCPKIEITQNLIKSALFLSRGIANYVGVNATGVGNRLNMLYGFYVNTVIYTIL